MTTTSEWWIMVEHLCVFFFLFKVVQKYCVPQYEKVWNHQFWQIYFFLWQPRVKSHKNRSNYRCTYTSCNYSFPLNLFNLDFFSPHSKKKVKVIYQLKWKCEILTYKAVLCKCALLLSLTFWNVKQPVGITPLSSHTQTNKSYLKKKKKSLINLMG